MLSFIPVWIMTCIMFYRKMLPNWNNSELPPSAPAVGLCPMFADYLKYLPKSSHNLKKRNSHSKSHKLRVSSCR